MSYVLNSSTMSLVQKSVLQQPGFFGSEQGSESLSMFKNAINIATAVSGFASSLQGQTAPSNYVRSPTNYILTSTEKQAISNKANQLALKGVVPYDQLVQFFYIMAAIENQSDLAYIGNVVGIPELDNAKFIRNILAVLGLKDIYKISYLASAVATVIQTFAPQFQNAASAGGDKNSNDILSNINSLLGGANMLLAQTGGNAIGNFLSELVTGSRISTQQIARNPNLSPPSYQGKAFFGESLVSLPSVDQLFCRKVGAYPVESSAVGALSFGLQNFGSFSQGLPINQVISKFTTGSFSVPNPSSFIGQSMNTLIDNTCNILNVGSTSTIEMFRGDNAVPFMTGFSAAVVEQIQSVFSIDVFSEGWEMATSVANQVQNINPDFLVACITSL